MIFWDIFALSRIKGIFQVFHFVLNFCDFSMFSVSRKTCQCRQMAAACINNVFSLSTLQPAINGGECQPGYYCPEGSHQQTPCTPGLYCELTGLHAPTNSCEPAYYCPSGSSSPQEEPCPVGHYCPLETAIPVPCSNGTYNPSIKQDEASDCLPCEAGYYCNETGASTTSGECAPRKSCHQVFFFLLCVS